MILTDENSIVIRPILRAHDTNDDLRAVVCPITNQSKDYLIEIPIPEGFAFTGVVVTDQFKRLDVKKRKIKIVGSVSEDTEFMKDILRNVQSILS